MKIFVYLYRIFICFVVLFSFVTGFKALLSIYQDVYYWVALIVVALGVIFVLKDTHKTKKQQKTAKYYENNGQVREDILNNLLQSFNCGEVSENRIFHISFENSERFVFCDTYKKDVGISNCDYKKSFIKSSQKEITKEYAREIIKVLNGEIIVISAFDKDGNEFLCTACEKAFKDTLVNKFCHPLKTASVFKKIVYVLLAVFPTKASKIVISDFSGREETLINE